MSKIGDRFDDRFNGMLLASSAGPGSSGVNAANAKAVYKRAMEAKKRNDFASAKADLEVLIAACEAKSSVRKALGNVLVAQAYIAYAECLYWTGEAAKSVEYFREGIRLLEAVNQKKDDIKWMTAEAYGESGKAKVAAAVELEKQGKTAEARALYEEGVSDMKTSLGYIGRTDGKTQYYTDWDTNVRVQQINFTLGWVLQYKLQRPLDAVPYYEATIKHYKSTGKVAQGVSLGDTYMGLAQIYDHTTKEDLKALPYYKAAIQLYEQTMASLTASTEEKGSAAKKLSEAYLGAGEILAIIYMSGKDETGAAISETRRNELLLGIVDTYFAKSDEPRAKLWMAKIYSIVAGDSLDRLEKAYKFLSDNMSLFKEGDYHEARLLRAELDFRIQILKNNGQRKKNYNFTEATKDVNYVLQNSKDKTLIARAYLLKGKIELVEGKIDEAASSTASAASMRNDVPPYVQQEIDSAVKIMEQVRPTGNAPEAVAASNSNPFGYRPSTISAEYHMTEGSQTISEPSGDVRDVTQKRTGETIGMEVPLGRTTGKNGGGSSITLIGRFTHDDFETTPTMAHYTNRIETTWDVSGNPIDWTEQSQDLKIMETRSYDSMSLGISYYRGMGNFSFWVAPQVEYAMVGYNTYLPTWNDYYNNFYDVNLTEENRTFSSTTASVRAHFELGGGMEMAGAGINPYLEGYYALSQRNMASAFEPLDERNLKYWRGLPEGTPERAQTIRELEDKLVNDPLQSYQIRLGAKFSMPWTSGDSPFGETTVDLNVGYGANPISDSLGGFWPVNDAMRDPKLSPEIRLGQSFILPYQMRLGVNGMYHQDYDLSGPEGNGYYWGGGVFFRFDGVDLFGMDLDPELYYEYTQSDSESTYHGEGQYFGVRLMGPQ